MKRMINQFTSYVLVILIVFGLTLNSCETDTDEVMTLPPTGSLAIDLSQFPSNTTKAESAFFGNWLYSSLTAFAWNVVLAVNVAIPIAAYAEAFNQTPVYLGDKAWEWSYSVPVNNITYEASLIGTRIDKDWFTMEMTLSQVGGFQDFKWFEGEIMYNHTAAIWVISHSPTTPTEYLEIDYEKDIDTEVASIRYTVTDPENDIYQAYIEYGIDPAYDFDAYYTIFKNDSTTYIEWSTTSNAGRVMDEAQFGDAEWHCWDSQLLDVDCLVEE